MSLIIFAVLLVAGALVSESEASCCGCICPTCCCKPIIIKLPPPPCKICPCCCCGCCGGGGRRKRRSIGADSEKKLSDVLLPKDDALAAARNPFSPRPSDFGRLQRCADCQGCLPTAGDNLRKTREVTFTVKDIPFKHEKLHDDVPEIDSFVKGQSALPDQDRTHQVLFRNNLEVVVKEENKSLN